MTFALDIIRLPLLTFFPVSLLSPFSASTPPSTSSFPPSSSSSPPASPDHLHSVSWFFPGPACSQVGPLLGAHPRSIVSSARPHDDTRRLPTSDSRRQRRRCPAMTPYAKHHSLFPPLACPLQAPPPPFTPAHLLSTPGRRRQTCTTSMRIARRAGPRARPAL